MEQLNDPNVVSDQNNFRKLMKEQSDLAPIVEAYKAYKEAKQTVEDSLMILDEESDEEMREISLLENIQRENLTAIELAWAYKGIIDNLDIRQEDLAKKIGKSRSHITNTLGLLNLPEDVQKKILDGEISMGHARVLSKMNDEDEVTDLANKVIEDNISVHELEEISKKEEIKKRMPITRRKMDTDYFHIENELRDILGTKVKVDNKKVSIYFENVNDLNRILEIMNIEIK